MAKSAPTTPVWGIIQSVAMSNFKVLKIIWLVLPPKPASNSLALAFPERFTSALQIKTSATKPVAIQYKIGFIVIVLMMFIGYDIF